MSLFFLHRHSFLLWQSFGFVRFASTNFKPPLAPSHHCTTERLVEQPKLVLVRWFSLFSLQFFYFKKITIYDSWLGPVYRMTYIYGVRMERRYFHHECALYIKSSGIPKLLFYVFYESSRNSYRLGKVIGVQELCNDAVLSPCISARPESRWYGRPVSFVILPLQQVRWGPT